MNKVHTTERPFAAVPSINLTPLANHGPGSTEVSKPKANAETYGMVSMWTTMKEIHSTEDRIFALLWICSQAALVACFFWLP